MKFLKLVGICVVWVVAGKIRKWALKQMWSMLKGLFFEV